MLANRIMAQFASFLYGLVSLLRMSLLGVLISPSAAPFGLRHCLVTQRKAPNSVPSSTPILAKALDEAFLLTNFFLLPPPLARSGLRSWRCSGVHAVCIRH